LALGRLENGPMVVSLDDVGEGFLKLLVAGGMAQVKRQNSCSPVSLSLRNLAGDFDEVRVWKTGTDPSTMDQFDRGNPWGKGVDN